jgi:membrane protein YdbS with pleckstrin-like domain
VLPLTFMIAMAWACESHTRQLGRRILLFYDGQADSTREAIAAAERRTDKGHDRRQALRVVALVLSIAIPIGFVAVANYYRQSTGISWLGALGALVALSLVVAITVVTARR